MEHIIAFIRSTFKKMILPGRVAQSATCLPTDASVTSDPGVVSSVSAQSHTLVEIDHEIISMVILQPSAESFKKGRLYKLAQEKVWLGELTVCP